ncbi:uncharacterized protein LOC21406178 isoform X2 [Morus notabilis]|uniref:uncharacterized protein LOC21406178 isoform X2 n=1 Tax=Morus notabilis TaxID=981085 RepID=UPI000CED7208|nr:uncharacterized protein LOC21406178 isoform X2 [Morus notabilis]
MDAKLIAASLDGKIDDFYDLIRECPNILEEVDKMLVDNPMHLAAINGHTHFAVEMMRLNPSFAKRLNPDGFSPLQLALQNDRIQTVLRLLAMDRDGDLVRVQGREGMSPLHYVAKHGNNQLLSAFLSTCPTALEDVTIRNQTALHVALDNDNVDCVEIILKCYERFPQSRWEKMHLNWKDDNGNTPLHVATTRKQTKVVRTLIDRQVDINAINLGGLTALAISEQPDELGSDEISSMLHCAGASAAVLLPIVNTIELALSVDERMKAAAERGDIDMLYSLIREDPHVLDRIDDTPFVDTPLHIAASLGHAKFATEAMLLKSSLARKLNQDGFTPLHLATLQGQTKMVDRLLDIDSDLVRVHGKEGKTPLHYAAERGNMGLVKIFLFYCPSSIQDVTNLSETVLHIAVESRKFDVFSLLVFQVRTSLMKGSQKTEYNILNWGNDVGDTALHIAVKTHQPEVVRVLIDSNVGLDVKNSDGFTALKILELGDSQVNNGEAREVMKEMLRCARASKTSSCVWWKSSKPSSPPTISTSLTNATEHLNTIEGACNVSAPPTSSTTSAVNHELDIALEGQPEEESRSMILVALVLFATVEYQIVLSPPGGLWQEDNNNSTATHDKKIHPPGTVVMGNLSFLFFMLLNSLALAITTHGIVLLLLELESRWWTINRILMNTLTFLCYLISLQTISPNNSLFALIIVIPATVFILLPYTHDWITQRLENRTRKWYRDEEQCNGY